MKAARTGRSTMTRLVAVQACPVSPNPAIATSFAARSRSASARTIVGFLDPISNWQRIMRGATA